MFREITLGQYYPKQSLIHRLDPRVKLLGVLIYIISLFIADSVFAYAFSILFLVITIIISGVPFLYMIRGLKAILVILILSTLLNLFLTSGEPLFTFIGITITYEGVYRALQMLIRLVCLILVTSLLTFTTTPNQLTDGLEKGLGFLKVIKVPVHEIAMMITIALRFIPILTEELDKIMKAQMARGADFESGNFLHRAKALVPLLVPLFVSAFRRASELAQAMEARCYHGGKNRTRMYPLTYGKADIIAYVFLLVYFAETIFFKVLGI